LIEVEPTLPRPRQLWVSEFLENLLEREELEDAEVDRGVGKRSRTLYGDRGSLERKPRLICHHRRGT